MRTGMGVIAFAVAGVLAGCASDGAAGGAAASAQGGETALLNDDDSRRVCRRIRAETGSHLGGRRECRTVAEWREVDGATQEMIANNRGAAGDATTP